MKSRIALSILALICLFFVPGLAFALSGGPDAHGYRYEDSVLVEWKNIASSGVHLNLGKNSITKEPIDIGFNFVFYGNTYSKVTIASNGLLTFSPEVYRRGYTSGQTLPTPGGYAQNTIAALWDYLWPNNT